MDLTRPTDLVRDIDDRKVSPTVLDLYTRMRELDVPRLDELGVDGARAAVESSVRGQHQLGAVEVIDGDLPSAAGWIASRSYRAGVNQKTSGQAIIVYFHGGGWVTGSLDTADATCRELALMTGIDVVSIDYRRAPEHPFPAAINDAVAAVTQVAADGPDRLILAGDSAGGFVALKAASAIPSLVSDLMLFYPAVQPAGAIPPRSWIENQNDLVLPAKTMDWFWNLFLADASDNPTPCHSQTSSPKATSFPRTFIVTCGLDVLRDEGDELARELAAAGVDVRHETYPGAPHGFFSFTKRLPFGGDAIERARWWLRG